MSGPTLPGFGRAPSRLHRKQISVYADPESVRLFKEDAVGRGMTVEQALGTAINRQFQRHGFDAPLEVVRLSSTRPARAAARDGGPTTRTGKTALSGWYDRKGVDKAVAHCAILGTTLQRICAAAVRRELERRAELQQ